MNNTKKKGLGFLTFIVVNSIVGVGLLLVPPLLAQSGLISLAAIGVCGLGASSIAYCISLLAQDVETIEPVSNLTRQNLPAFTSNIVDFLGVLNAFFCVLTLAYSLATHALMASHYFNLPVTIHELAAIILSSVYFIIYRSKGEARSRNYQIATSVSMLFKVSLIAFCAYMFFELFSLDNFVMNATSLSNFEATSQACLKSVFILSGFEGALQLTQIAKNPKRDIPIAMVAGTLLSALVFATTVILICGSVNVRISNIADLDTISTFLLKLNYNRGIKVAVSLFAIVCTTSSLYIWLYSLLCSVSSLNKGISNKSLSEISGDDRLISNGLMSELLSDERLVAAYLLCAYYATILLLNACGIHSTLKLIDICSKIGALYYLVFSLAALSKIFQRGVAMRLWQKVVVIFSCVFCMYCLVIA